MRVGEVTSAIKTLELDLNDIRWTVNTHLLGNNEHYAAGTFSDSRGKMMFCHERAISTN